MRQSSRTVADDGSVARLVEAERVALLYRLTPRTLATAAVFSFIVFLTLRGVVPMHLLLPWLAVNNGVTALRFLDILAYRRSRPTVAQSRYWLGRFVALTATAGTIWGLPKDRAIVVIRDNADVEADSSPFFSSDRVAIRAKLRVSFGWPHPAAIAKITTT